MCIAFDIPIRGASGKCGNGPLTTGYRVWKVWYGDTVWRINNMQMIDESREDHTLRLSTVGKGQETNLGSIIF